MEQERENAVTTDVLGDVLLRVVRAHLSTIVDVLLEDIAEDVWVDVPSRSGQPVVEMPMPLVEEREELLEDLVGNVDVAIAGFDLVFGEHAAVQIGNATVGLDEILCPPFGRLVEPVAEQVPEKAPVKRIELVLAARLLHPCELVGQIVLVQVEEALLLNEVAEHKAVEHDRRVPLAIRIVLDALNAFHKLIMLLSEALVELLRHSRRVYQERGVDAIHHIDDGRLFVERE